MPAVADLPPAARRVQRAFDAVYGPGRVASSGHGPLAGIGVWRGEDRWHFSTLGLAVVRPATRDGSSPRALRHELTILTPPAPEPPTWAFGLLDGAARTVIALGRPYHAGARLAPGGPVDGAGSGLVAFGIRADPIVALDGGDLVLQLVGTTAGEYLLMQRVGTALVLERLAARDPLLRTDPGRA